MISFQERESNQTGELTVSKTWTVAKLWKAEGMLGLIYRYGNGNVGSGSGVEVWTLKISSWNYGRLCLNIYHTDFSTISQVYDLCWMRWETIQHHPPHKKVMKQENLSETWTVSKIEKVIKQKNLSKIWTVSKKEKVIKQENLQYLQPEQLPSCGKQKECWVLYTGMVMGGNVGSGSGVEI